MAEELEAAEHEPEAGQSVEEEQEAGPGIPAHGQTYSA